MRIAVDMRPLSVPGSGIARYVGSLTTALQAIAPRHDFHFLYKHPAFAGRTPAHHILQSPLWLQLAVPLHCRKHRVDVFHGTNFMVPRFNSARQVVTIHDLTLLTHPQVHTLRNRLLTGLQMRLGLPSAHRIIVPTRFVAGQVTELLGVPVERLIVVPEGVEPRFTPEAISQAARTRLTERYGLPPRYLLYVGALDSRKDLPTLLHAFARFVAREPAFPLDLVLAGRKGSAYLCLVRLAQRLGIAGRTHLIGYVEEVDLPALYAGAELFVWPSALEGFGLPVLEAMACGVPVVAADAPAVREVAGEAAILCTPQSEESLSEAIRQVYPDTSLRSNLKEKGQQRAAQFTWERAAWETLAVYTAALEG